MEDESDDITLTTRLLESLELILGMVNAVPGRGLEIEETDRRALWSSIDRLFGAVNRMMTWLSEQRLETPKN